MIVVEAQPRAASRAKPRGLRAAIFTASILVALTMSGCWLEEANEPPPFDCATIDRAEERFPTACGDAGAPLDAEVDTGIDSGTDAAP